MYKEDLDVLTKQLKNELDLITKTDEWLNQERVSLSTDIDEKVKDLERILLAMKIKRLLQSKNMVAVKHIIKNENGCIRDIMIKILSLPDAIDLLDDSSNIVGRKNFRKHISDWLKDGYDVDSSKLLRSSGI